MKPSKFEEVVSYTRKALEALMLSPALSLHVLNPKSKVSNFLETFVVLPKLGRQTPLISAEISQGNKIRKAIFYCRAAAVDVTLAFRNEEPVEADFAFIKQAVRKIKDHLESEFNH